MHTCPPPAGPAVPDPLDERPVCTG
jgi:hypothetical protein